MIGKSHEKEGWEPHRIHEAGKNEGIVGVVGRSIMVLRVSVPPGLPAICKKTCGMQSINEFHGPIKSK